MSPALPLSPSPRPCFLFLLRIHPIHRLTHSLAHVHLVIHVHAQGTPIHPPIQPPAHSLFLSPPPDDGFPPPTTADARRDAARLGRSTQAQRARGHRGPPAHPTRAQRLRERGGEQAEVRPCLDMWGGKVVNSSLRVSVCPCAMCPVCLLRVSMRVSLRSTSLDGCLSLSVPSHYLHSHLTHSLLLLFPLLHPPSPIPFRPPTEKSCWESSMCS